MPAAARSACTSEPCAPHPTRPQPAGHGGVRHLQRGGPVLQPHHGRVLCCTALPGLREAASAVQWSITHGVGPFTRRRRRPTRCPCPTRPSAAVRAGQERREVPGAEHTACTVEMVSMARRVDVAVLDEIQMIGDESRCAACGLLWPAAAQRLVARAGPLLSLAAECAAPVLGYRARSAKQQSAACVGRGSQQARPIKAAARRLCACPLQGLGLDARADGRARQRGPPVRRRLGCAWLLLGRRLACVGRTQGRRPPQSAAVPPRAWLASPACSTARPTRLPADRLPARLPACLPALQR